jgi:hypothetical protein
MPTRELQRQCTNRQKGTRTTQPMKPKCRSTNTVGRLSYNHSVEDHFEITAPQWKLHSVIFQICCFRVLETPRSAGADTDPVRLPSDTPMSQKGGKIGNLISIVISVQVVSEAPGDGPKFGTLVAAVGGEGRSPAENDSADCSDTTAAPHEYFGYTGSRRQ